MVSMKFYSLRSSIMRTTFLFSFFPKFLLQALYSPNHSNVVVCNLVFLRGLCPVLYSLSSLGKTICSESLNGSIHGILSGFPNDVFHSSYTNSTTNSSYHSWSSFPQLNSGANSPTVPSHASEVSVQYYSVWGVLLCRTLIEIMLVPCRLFWLL